MNPGNVSLNHRSRGNPQFRADSLADDTVSDMLGVWQPVPDTASATERTRVHAEQWQRIAEANRLIAGWQSNADLPGWQAPPGAPPELAKALQHYVQVAPVLPDWADPAKIQRAEALFMDYGAMSCALLFCSSLPECYVIPDLAGVLHESGQLEQRT